MQRTAKVLVRRHGPLGSVRRPDEVIVEEPLEIRLDDQLVATTMRTPGHDFELAVGFVHAEGLTAGAVVRSVRYCGTGSGVDTEFNVVSVDTDGHGPAVTPRLGPVTSACGVCGSDQLAQLAARLVPFGGVGPLSAQVLDGVHAAVAQQQDLFERTGAVHAAWLVDPVGRVELVREDIGRHNAVDKLVGRLCLDGRLGDPELANSVVVVSSRASYEMVQKTWAAGVGSIVAVSAPSSLAIDTAERAGMNLVGFWRGSSFNVYSGSVD